MTSKTIFAIRADERRAAFVVGDWGVAASGDRATDPNGVAMSDVGQNHVETIDRNTISLDVNNS